MMRSLACLLVAVPLFGQVNVADIVRKSSANTERNWKEAPSFVFTERDVVEKLDGSGHVKSRTVKTYESMVLDGSDYNRVVAINDKPLSPQQQRAEDEKMARERERRRKESPAERQKRVSKYQRERQQDNAMMREMVNAFNYKLIGEETVHGRPCWVLQATPRPGYVPKNRDSRVLTGMQGKLWIDKADVQWAKVEAEVVKPVAFYAVATVTPGTKFTLEQKPVGDGVWLPAHFAVKVNSSILSVFSHNSLDDETYTNYRRAGGDLAKAQRASSSARP